MSCQEPPAESVGLRSLPELQGLLAGEFEIRSVTEGARGELRLCGRVHGDAHALHERLRDRLQARGRTVLLRREGGDDVLLVLPGMVQAAPDRQWVPLLLGALTVLSMLFTYAFFWEATELSWRGIVQHLHKGWAFTISLLSILLAHELGHFFTARRHGVAVTLPYLIPFPLSPFGTMGAVIRMKDVPPNRRAMLLIGAAGPIAGLVVAVPVLLLGLSLSEVADLPAQGAYWVEGNSLLYLALKAVTFGRLLPADGVDVHLHPVAFAGWAGLLVTSFNLIPAGQLDGGHVAQALLGRRARYLTGAMVAALFLLGLWWQGWLLWAFLVYLFSRVTVQPQNDITPLDGRSVAIGVTLLLLFVLTFTPLPLRLVVM